MVMITKQFWFPLTAIVFKLELKLFYQHFFVTLTALKKVSGRDETSA